MRQEMLTRSGAPDFICFPCLEGRSTLQCHFVGHLWLGVVWMLIVGCMLSHVFVMLFAYFPLFSYLLVVCFMFVICFGTGRFSASHGSCRPLFGVVPCVVSRFVGTVCVVPAWAGGCTGAVLCVLNVGVIVCPILSENGL